jgi:hypothetical protein
MQQLKLEDICVIKKVDQPHVKCCYVDYNTGNSISTPHVPSMSIQVKEQDIKLTKYYDKNNDKILKELIDKLLEKKYDGNNLTIKNLLKFTIYDTNELYSHNIANDVPRKFLSRILNLSNHIAMESRVGSADSIVSDNHAHILEHLHHSLSNFNMFHYHGLGNKIIIFKKPDIDRANWSLCHTDDYYALEEIGDYSTQYHVVEIIGLKQLRIKKMNRILND